MQKRRVFAAIGAFVVCAAVVGVIVGVGGAGPGTSRRQSAQAAAPKQASATTASTKDDVIAGIFSTRGAARAELSELEDHHFSGFTVKKEQARTTISAGTGLTGTAATNGTSGTTGATRRSTTSASATGAGGVADTGIRYEAVEGFPSKKQATAAAKKLRHAGFLATVKKA